MNYKIINYIKTIKKNINTLLLYNYINSSNIIYPYIYEHNNINYSQIDIFSKLMMNRIIFIGSEITSDISNIIQSQLLFLDSVNTDNIKIYINSPGGDIYSGLGIYDTMQLIKSKISTTCIGLAASMAAVLLCSGYRGKRYSLKHSRIMIHQPIINNFNGQESDIYIKAKEIKRLKKELYKIISYHTNNNIKKIIKDADRDYWMTSKKALSYGMIDKILYKKNKNKKK
ncbi:MAG: ATP-dependent Clp protease proteolytic subunit [Candidatus Shikimatogenerans bostrichidophilus]|nr:MAG: ATP-dependent Clp protease proteolytic subunit [Candidatus Shikimatogenerans bostrichidophilus]